MRRLLLIAAVLLPIASPAFAVSTCEKYGTISVMGGQYTIINNIWGASTAQCIDVPSTSQNAFTVTSSSHNQNSVASYPAVYKGCHWGACTSGSGMPIVYSQVSSAPFSWSVTRSTSGGMWNIAAEAWLSPNSSSANGYNGGAEIMIWLDYAGGMNPAGSRVGTANIAGASWEVWYGNIGWNYVAYRRIGAASSISADLKAFIDDSVNRGYVQRSWYLHAFEAGTELMVGGAGFRSNSFSFTVNGGGGGGGTTYYSLNVTRSGAGTGTVSSNPSGINCGSTCSASYASGTTVTLSASPASGSTFGGWSGACTGTGSCIVSMTAARSVTATFNGGGGGTTYYSLNVTRSGTGTGTVTSSPSGINCGSTCSASYASGTTVTLNAAPASSATFSGWSGACTGTGSCIVSMTAARSVTATFGSSGGGGTGSCSNAITFTSNTGNFNTTGAVCYRTAQRVNGWGCSNFAGRTVSVNGGAATASCGAGPFPLGQSGGYTYFSVSAGQYPWASIYIW